jgi:lipoprotein-anchoring transpeptidase ErfK/SrfK
MEFMQLPGISRRSVSSERRGNSLVTGRCLRSALMLGAAFAVISKPADAQRAPWFPRAEPRATSGAYGATPVRTASRKPRHHRGDEAKKTQPSAKGPHLIVVSIGEQRVSLFGDGALVARSAVSTGMRGHPTPEGVFSVIQKDRYHRSNIYSSAPMPFMQRITWSGVALHAGVLPGYPASHGCIRLTYEFATMLWRTTQIGARVIVTRHGVEPVEIAHPNLFVPKAKSDEPPLASDPPVKASDLGIRLRFADASDSSLARDAGSSLAGAAAAQTETPDPSDALVTATGAEQHGDQSDAPSTGEAQQTTAQPAQTTEPAVEPAASTASDSAEPPKPVDTAAPVDAPKTTEPPAVVPVKSTEAPVLEPAATGSTNPPANDTAPAQPAELPKTAEPPTASEPLNVAEPPKPDETPKAAEAPKPTADPVELMEAAKAEFAAMSIAVEPPRKKEQVSVLVSRKEGRLFVRQNFLPLFSVPVTIRSSERGLGTHVFTAMEPIADGSAMRWTVVTISGQHAAKAEPAERRGRKSRRARDEEAKPAVHEPESTAAQALDRIEMPKDAAARVSELLVPGFALIVSDHGVSGETNDGTDFIILTR